MDFVNARRLGNKFRTVLGIAGEHGGDNALLANLSDGFHRILFQGVGNDDVADEFAVSGNQHLRAEADFLPLGQVNPMGFQQLPVAAEELAQGGVRRNSLTGNFLKIGGLFDGNALFLGGGDDAHGDGVGGEQLTAGGHGQKLAFADAFPGGKRGLNHEVALGDGAGFVHDHGLDAAQRLDCIAALEENVLLGGGADAGEEGQGHAENQRAGTGDDQEGQSGEDGGGAGGTAQDGFRTGIGRVNEEVPAGNQEGQHQRHHQSADNHGGGVHPGKPGDEFVDIGFIGGGVFHGIQNPGDHGLFQQLFCPDFQSAGGVDAAGDHAVADGGLHGHRLTGDGRGVDPAFPLDDHAVQGNPVAGAHQQNVAHVGFLRVNDPDVLANHQVDYLRPQIHRVHDLLAALADGTILKILADAIEEHNAHGLGKVPDGECTQCGNGHQEILVKDLTLFDVPEGGHQNLAAQNQVGQGQHAQKHRGGSA